MSRNHAIAIAIAVLMASALLLLFGGDLVGLRVVVGIPFLLLLPGHAAMLFVDPDSRTGGFDWLALTVALSVSITAMAGVALGMSVGISQRGIVLAVAAASSLFLLAAAVRSRSVAARRPEPIRRSPVRRAAWAAAALLACTVVTLWLSIPHENASHRAEVVQLWAIRDSAAQGGLRIGVTNIDASPSEYRLTISQSGRALAEQTLHLPAGATRVVHVNRSQLSSGTARVEAVVSDASSTISPRRVSVWMPQ